MFLTGAWRVGQIIDPRGDGGAPSQQAREELLASDLPFPGDTVAGRGGRVCAPDRCLDVRWVGVTVQEAFGRKSVSAGLGLKAGAPDYALVEEGKTKAFALQRADGHVLFPIPLCDKDETCWTGFADWAPASKDAALGQPCTDPRAGEGAPGVLLTPKERRRYDSSLSVWTVLPPQIRCVRSEPLGREKRQDA